MKTGYPVTMAAAVPAVVAPSGVFLARHAGDGFPSGANGLAAF